MVINTRPQTEGKSLKIAYLGDFSTLSQGPNSVIGSLETPEESLTTDCYSENHLCEAFKSLGHEIIPIQDNSTNMDEILDISSECDLFLHTPTHSIRHQDGHDFPWLFDKLTIPTAIFDRWEELGLHEKLDAHYCNDHHNQRDYDYVFTSPRCGDDKFWKSIGVDKHYDIHAAIPKSLTKRGKPIPQIKEDIILLQSSKARYSMFENNLYCRWLRERYSVLIVNDNEIGGNSGYDLNDLVLSGKIITIAYSLFREHYRDCYLEVCGRGGFLVSPTTMPSLVLQEELMITPRDRNSGEITDFTGYEKILDYYLENDTQRELFKLKCHNYIKQNHTYSDRASEILSIIFQREDK